MASGSLPSAIEAALQAADPVELAARLVRIPSHPGIERQEEAVVRSLTEWLAAHGIESSLDEVAAGRPNLLVTLDSGRPGRHLVLCGHTDTVPLNRDDPGVGLSGEVRDGRLLGRGSVDMKGAVAAMAAAVVALEASGALEAGRVTLAAVVDEEMGGSGIDHLVATGFSADGAIVGEPSENRLLLGHKGLEWLEVRLAGASAHGGTPERGVNAIDAAARFLELVRSELVPRFTEREHPLLGRPTINAGTIRGGDQPSTVAASCAIAMDRRSVPGEDYASMTAELGEILDRVAAEMPGLEWSLGRVVGGSSSDEGVRHPAGPPPGRGRAACGAPGRRGAAGRGSLPRLDRRRCARRPQHAGGGAGAGRSLAGALAARGRTGGRAGRSGPTLRRRRGAVLCRGRRVSADPAARSGGAAALARRLPHTWVLLAILVSLAAAATWVVPGGEYERVIEGGRELVDPESFTPRPADRAGIGDLLLAFPRGLVATAPIVFFIFLIGGSFRVLNATGAIEAGIERLARS